MTVSIRSALEADAPRIVEMSHTISEHVAGPPSLLSVETFLRHGFGSAALFECYVAEVDRVLVGHVGITLGFEFESNCPTVWIADLFVDAGHRRRGIARALMAQAGKRANEIGAGYLQWSMVSGNVDAAAFYDTLDPVRDDGPHLYLDKTGIGVLIRER